MSISGSCAKMSVNIVDQGQRVVEFEMVSDYTNDMFESGVF